LPGPLNRARIKFFQESLQITVTKEEALRHLKEGYAAIFKDTPVEAAIDRASEAPNDGGAAAS